MAWVQLRHVLSADALKGKPVLVLANKNDLPFSKSAMDIEKALGMPAQHKYGRTVLCVKHFAS